MIFKQSSASNAMHRVIADGRQSFDIQHVALVGLVSILLLDLTVGLVFSFRTKFDDHTELLQDALA